MLEHVLRPIFLLCVLIFWDFALAQQHDRDTLFTAHGDTMIILKSSSLSSVQHPLTKDTNNVYPTELDIKGIIVDYTLGHSCGVTCGSGTIKIKLTRKIKNYDCQYAFLVIPCFSWANDKILNNKIAIKCPKLEINNSSCYFNDSIFNSFDTEGIPFYIGKSLKTLLPSY